MLADKRYNMFQFGSNLRLYYYFRKLMRVLKRESYNSLFGMFLLDMHIEKSFYMRFIRTLVTLKLFVSYSVHRLFVGFQAGILGESKSTFFTDIVSSLIMHLFHVLSQSWISHCCKRTVFAFKFHFTNVVDRYHMSTQG